MVALKVILFCLVLGTATSSVQESFEDSGIVPDIIPKAPNRLVTVKYPSGAVVQLGNELTPSQTKDEPIALWSACSLSYYTLAMIDPDVTSRANPDMRSLEHWLVGNIPGQVVASGEILAKHIGPAPPKGTGKHRYVFLVYKQNGRIKFDEQRLLTTAVTNRTKFSIANFAKKYNLGDPVYGNYFVAQFQS